MSLTLAEAHDRINTIITAAWPVDAALYLPLVYDGVPLTALQQAVIEGSDEDSVLAWARIRILDNLRNQTTIGNEGNRRYTNKGVVRIEVYTPDGDGRQLDRALCSALVHALEPVNSGSLWFRDAAFQPIGPDRFWWHSNVTAGFEWVEIR
jgi:hypothetical protein